MQHTLFILVFYGFFWLDSVRSASDCFNPDVSLTQKVENEGFHRELRWLLERNADPRWDSNNCKLALKFDVSKEMYVNPDEVTELNRLGLLPGYIEGNVDVEAIAHLSTPHTVYIYLNHSEKVSIKLPVHLRYQRAAITGGFGKVPVNKPNVLAICLNVCGKAEVEAPCDAGGLTKCVWKNVKYQALFGQVELLVPVGALDDYPLVSIVTLLLGCAGCIYTLSILSTTPL